MFKPDLILNTDSDQYTRIRIRPATPDPDPNKTPGSGTQIESTAIGKSEIETPGGGAQEISFINLKPHRAQRSRKMFFFGNGFFKEAT